MNVALRQATRSDIPAMHRVRLAVTENRLTSTAITEEHYIPAIEQTGRGWVIEVDGIVQAFAVGNKVTGNIWALFVDPAHERRGFGRQLHDAMVSWLLAQGLQRLWLGTGPDTRAQRFYEAAGWQAKGGQPDGEILFELRPGTYDNVVGAAFGRQG